MHDAGVVRHLQRVGHLHGVLEHLRHAQAALGNQVHEGLALHPLHHHQRIRAVVENVVNGDDIGMIQRGRGLRFLQEAAAALGIGGVGVR